jgi:hypothetical protein
MLHETRQLVTAGTDAALSGAMTNHSFESIDLAQLDTATGGWNPIKSIAHKAHQAYDKVKSGVETGVNWVNQHRDVLFPKPTPGKPWL